MAVQAQALRRTIRQQPRRRSHPVRNTAIALALLIALCEVAAAEGLAPITIADAERSPSATAVAIVPDTPLTSTLTAVRSHLDVPTTAVAGANGRPVNELAGVNYRWWLSHGAFDVGLGVGSIGYVVPPPDGRFDGPRTLAGSVPTISVGWRYRMSQASAIYADASRARGLGTDGQRDYVNAKVGLEWKPAHDKWGFERGAFGVHFDSGYHLSLRARHGGLGIYLRNQF